MSDCVFCAIIRNEAPAAAVWRSSDAVAFLDRTPVFPGHVLVVPTAHCVTLPDLAADAIGPFFAVVQRIAALLPTALGADGTWVSMNNVVSQSVAHLHVHVVPRRRKDGLKGFYWPRQRYPSDDAMYETAAVITAALTAEFKKDGGAPH